MFIFAFVILGKVTVVASTKCCFRSTQETVSETLGDGCSLLGRKPRRAIPSTLTLTLATGSTWMSKVDGR